MSAAIRMPLNNIQTELLGLFSENLSEQELLEIKNLLVEWRFKKLKSAANNAYDAKGYSDEDMERLLKTNLRKPYKSQEDFLNKKSKSGE